MDVETARGLLVDGTGDEEPVFLPAAVLEKLTIDDVPDETLVGVGIHKDGMVHVDWEGHLFKDGKSIAAEAEYVYTRKYWYQPIGLEEYLDLVSRAVEARQKAYGDVEMTNYEDDGAYINLSYLIRTQETNLGRAFNVVEKIRAELEEVSQGMCDAIAKQIAETAARVSGWGAESLDNLIHAVESSKTTDEKGRSLEELCSRLFETITGFSVSGRVRTETEEIDISILNDSQEPRLRREGALILAECKNWTGRCGKNEFVIFKQKLENRSQRCTLGVLLSWNGFSETLTKEMLRGSREQILIVPVTGKELRTAVREGNFVKVLLECWDNAVNL